MLTLLQVLRMKGSEGEPLPTVFQNFARKGVSLRRGECILCAAGPGTGKSVLTLTIALKAKVPTLYFSADTNGVEVAARAYSVLTGTRVSDARAMADRDDTEPFRAALEGLPVRLIGESSPTLEDITLQIDAYREVYGEYPSLIVVDNIKNVRMDAGDEGASRSLDALTHWLHDVARDTQACVIGLHHVNAGSVNGTDPIPLNGVKDQVTAVPEVVLTIFKRKGDEFTPDVLCVSPVKNRGGRADPTGNTYAELEFDGDRMQIKDYE